MKKYKASWRETAALSRRAFFLWYQRHPAMILSATAHIAVHSVTPYIAIWFSARIIDELAGQRDTERLLQLVLLTLGITAALTLLGAVCKRWREQQRNIRYGRTSRIHTEALLDMDFCVLDRQETYDLLSKIRGAQNWNQWGLLRILDCYEQLLEALVRIGGAVALTVGLFISPVPQRSDWLMQLDHPLVLFGLLMLFLGLVLSSAVADDYGTDLYSKMGEEAAQANRRFFFFGFEPVNSASRTLDVRMYRQETICGYYFQNASVFGWDGHISKMMTGPCAGSWAAAAGLEKAFTGVAYVYVCLKAWAGAFGVGAVTQYIGAITAMSQGAISLLKTLIELRSNAPYLKTTFEFLDLPHEMYQGSLTTEKRSDRQYQVEFRDVSFKYPGSDQWALRHVNMKFEVGRRLAVVGQNGSGKTTFIKLLCRLYDPTEGQILLNGIDIRKYNYQDYLAIFSVVFQDFQLLAFPLGQNVAAAKDYDPVRAEDCLRKAGFGDRLDSLPDGLETCLYREFDQKGVEISGGEAQKIAIARALYPDAPFIILDEPTAALDPIAEAEIYSKFDEIAGDKTAIYISHRLSSCRFCDDILVFDQGRVIQQGSHEELVADESGKYYALWHAQAQYYTKR